jgi:hypothetical protein
MSIGKQPGSIGEQLTLAGRKALGGRHSQPAIPVGLENTD